MQLELAQPDAAAGLLLHSPSRRRILGTHFTHPRGSRLESHTAESLIAEWQLW